MGTLTCVVAPVPAAVSTPMTLDPVFHGARYATADRVEAEVLVVASSFPSITTTGLPVKLTPVIVSVTDPPVRTAGVTVKAGRFTGITRTLLVSAPPPGFMATMEIDLEPPAGTMIVADNVPALTYKEATLLPLTLRTVPDTNPAPAKVTEVVPCVRVAGEAPTRVGAELRSVRAQVYVVPLSTKSTLMTFDPGMAAGV